MLAFGANILGIKPSLAIIDGELKVVRKYRGSLPICVGKYITDLLDGRDDIDNSMVFISSCQPKPGCMEAIKAGLRKYGKFENIIETDIGTTIGGYSGPGTIGIVFAKKFNRHSTKAALPCGEFHGRAVFGYIMLSQKRKRPKISLRAF